MREGFRSEGNAARLRPRETFKCFRSTSRHRGCSPVVLQKGRPHERDFRAILKKREAREGAANYCILPRKCACTYERLARERIHFAFYKPFEETRHEAQSPSLRRTLCSLRFKGAYTVYTTSSSNGRGAHEDDGRCARARGTLVSHLVRFHRQKCRRRICSFRHDAVAVDHPYCSPRESGSQTASREGRDGANKETKTNYFLQSA